MNRYAVLPLLVAGVVAVQFGQPAASDPATSPPANEITQEFPTNDAMRTAWKVRWAASSGCGLYIQESYFKKSPTDVWTQVTGDVRLSEMFVPYATGSPRFWDVSYNFQMIPVGRDEAGPFGRILSPKVVAEVRDRGVMWMDIPKGTRRGQTLVLWGALDAANYRYITEYGFQDDGTITCRVGATGRNYGSKEFESHMHNGLWRVDLNVGGPNHNSVYVMERSEPEGTEPEQKAKARLVHRPFNDGVEGSEDWQADKFTMLSVVNTQIKNSRGKPIAYDICPMKMGNARHGGSDEEACTQHDFWVTRNRTGEIYYRKLPQYVSKKDSVLDTDVVVWLSTACQHEPRSEDGELRGSTFTGATPMGWAGFDLKPRNFNDRTPHYGPR